MCECAQWVSLVATVSGVGEYTIYAIMYTGEVLGQIQLTSARAHFAQKQQQQQQNL